MFLRLKNKLQTGINYGHTRRLQMNPCRDSNQIQLRSGYRLKRWIDKRQIHISLAWKKKRSTRICKPTHKDIFEVSRKNSCFNLLFNYNKRPHFHGFNRRHNPRGLLGTRGKLVNHQPRAILSKKKLKRRLPVLKAMGIGFVVWVSH